MTTRPRGGSRLHHRELQRRGKNLLRAPSICQVASGCCFSRPLPSPPAEQATPSQKSGQGRPAPRDFAPRPQIFQKWILLLPRAAGCRSALWVSGRNYFSPRRFQSARCRADYSMIQAHGLPTFQGHGRQYRVSAPQRCAPRRPLWRQTP